ncbi:amino acid ABC transporter permease [Eggerthellaceae bacterium zg-1084]|uniref:amino acid ABC transporter permease n=1 Tax=Berryella wangjianweii TaxID=2734634 RepID=UPI00155428D2|nr:amino acid ABC transporter permease [Berryella wangjianweii]NPD31554.1 amino acid ABC transporter permease [Berryella wangjianweii]NPD32951.1 amino acid ABC transporter permease [Eggerthellaceae bacterium zg-997]
MSVGFNVKNDYAVANVRPNGRIRAVALAVACATALLLALSCLPGTAQALSTSTFTARPNGDAGSQVLGGTETRLTWEGQAADDESVKQLSFTLPEGTAYALDNNRLTLLTGPDHMTRQKVSARFTAEGSTITAHLDGGVVPGAYYRVELYGVVFPAAGGSMQVQGAYALEDGRQGSLEGMAPLAITSVSPVDQLAKGLEQQDWVKAWNSNKFLRLFLNPPLLVSSFPVVLNGFFLALGIVAVAFPLAIPVGLAFALMRMSRFRVLRGIATTYVNVVRGTPMFLQIYIAFFGLPLAGFEIPSFPLGVVVLGMNSGAYLCEIFRGGIQSISKGQFEAARSLGMNAAQTMVHVVIPQTVRRVLPTMTSEFILLYKDTSLLAAVGVMEVVMYAKTIVASTGSITPYIVAAFFYLVLTLPLAKLVGLLERKLAQNDTGTSAKSKKGKAAQAVFHP